MGKSSRRLEEGEIMTEKDFLSDEEMEQLEKSQQPDFITDEEMEQLAGDESFLTAAGLKKAAIESLPIAGGLIGTLGGLPGVAAGAAAGKTLENIAEKYLLGEEKTRPQVYIEPAGEAVAAVTGEKLAPAIGQGIARLGSAIGRGARKTVSGLSSIPEKAIETYMDRPQAVKAIGDLSESTALQDASDELRKNAVQAIRDFQKDANNDIYYILKSKGDNLLDISSIKQSAEKTIKSLNPKIKEDAKSIADIQEMINQFTDLQVNPKLPFVKASDVHRMKQVLQDAVDYNIDGTVKVKSGFSEREYAKMASLSKQLVEKVAPEIKSINQKLAQMHNINRNINKNLISPEKTAAAVMGVGSGQNQQAIKQMEKLEDLTQFPYVSGAEEISSAQHFNNPPLLPAIQTGRGLAPIALGGQQALYQGLQGDVAGAAMGLGVASLGSPLAIKGMMDSILLAKKAGAGIGKMSPLGSAKMIEELAAKAIQMGVPPFLIEDQVKKMDELSASEKTIIRQKAAKAAK